MALLSGAAQAQAPIPSLTGRVVDLTGTLSAPEQQQLVQQLAALEQDKGAQVAVLMVDTTAGEPIENYAVRAFEAWKLGRAGIDDGVLLVVAKNDRTMRIEVGYGLEGALTDADAGRLIREHITPHFAAGDFAGGVQAGVQGISALVRQEPLPEPEVRAADEDAGWGEFGLAALFLAVVMGPWVAAILGAVVGYLALGGILGIGLGAVGAFIISAVFGALGLRRRLGRGGRRGPWGGGGPGGGFGGGGFGGGGGRSGGGGASGRW